ncbi:MAG: helicase-related protein [Caldilineaceae bacterium]
MPQIFDNIDQKLVPALSTTLALSYRADFCVGYFNLRGWQQIDAEIEKYTGGGDSCCRLLIGMHRHPQEELRQTFGLNSQEQPIDNQRAKQISKLHAEELRQQLTIGAPTNEDEAALRRLKNQLVEGKLQVKLYLRHPLHAKLYLLYRNDYNLPIVGYMGSSNLTFSGLSGNGELNIDVMDRDAAQKLSDWFEDRWEDRFCVDITQELIEIIDESWAREALIPPYYIYLKMAYHLSREAQKGIDEFRIPNPFGTILFDYQKAAVQIAARYLNQRNGVLIGDVVGLGKTLMATALVKIFEEDLSLNTLIICPKNLERMWEYQVGEYGLKAKVLPISMVQNELSKLPRYRLVLIDESHNLRNRDSKRYRAIREYIETNECRVILLSATPYNKSYLDLANQLRLFLSPEDDLGIRPEQLIREIGMVEFNRRYENPPPTSLLAFEKSEHSGDWQELMRNFMVRRTRSFIRENYADQDDRGYYLTYADGTRSYFPMRKPRRLDFVENEQYRRLYRVDVVDTINDLNLPRYGLAQYVKATHAKKPTTSELQILDDLSRGGKRLMGFCRTNLFKRLESSGFAFTISLERHILRNYVYLHALENGLDVPIGTQDVAVLDTRFADEDITLQDEDGHDAAAEVEIENGLGRFDPTIFKARAAAIYETYARQYKRRFRWLRSDLFKKNLQTALIQDAEDLLTILVEIGEWQAEADAKLDALTALLTQSYPQETVLIFSQFADTVHYLAAELPRRGVNGVEGVTGDHPDPTYAAWRFSPNSNEKRFAIAESDEIRVLVATDVLSEGQNLQDAYIVINFDLPWAIIRLIQRAGRVDRIGQKSDQIYCYSMWPADGVEAIINLRTRLRERLQQNAEVVGTDEIFFEDEVDRATMTDLYNERAGILDDDDDREVDLVSHAYQIWKNATDANPGLKPLIEQMPAVVYSSKSHHAAINAPGGVLVYLKTQTGNSSLAWIDTEGNHVSLSQFDILRAASCALDEPALPRQEKHHELVEVGVQQALAEQQAAGVQLGRATGARFKTYDLLKNHVLKMPLLAGTPEIQLLNQAIEQIGRYQLRESARDSLNRQLRSGISTEQLARVVIALYEEDKLCLVPKEEINLEPQIICSLGLIG